jgi:hypothetical protein
MLRKSDGPSGSKQSVNLKLTALLTAVIAVGTEAHVAAAK